MEISIQNCTNLKEYNRSLNVVREKVTRTFGFVRDDEDAYRLVHAFDTFVPGKLILLII